MKHDVFGRALEQGHVWVGQVAEGLDCDNDQAYRALRATLHTLRDRLTVEGAAHLSAQLPLIVRGIFFEQWDPSRVPDKMHAAELVERVRQEAVLPTAEDAEEAIRAVVAVMSEHLTPGALDHLDAQLPADLRSLIH